MCSGVERLAYGWMVNASAWRKDEQVLNSLFDSGALTKLVAMFLEKGASGCMISVNDPWNE